MHIPVSVVIPCYRCSKTIHRAVLSVVYQTFSPREVMLIDDYSNDGGETLNALEIIKRSIGEKIKIEIVALEVNNGPGAARNVGWDLAHEPYIAFLDADDSWHKRKLEIQYQWMKANPQAVMTGHKSKIVIDNEYEELLNEKIVSRRVTRKSMLIANQFPTRSVMLKRDIPYRFQPQKRYAEDYLLWMQIVLGDSPAYFLDTALAYSYKDEFGMAGLSKNLWKMEVGVQDSLRVIFEEKKISKAAYILAITFSTIKFIRRFFMAHGYLSMRRSVLGSRNS